MSKPSFVVGCDIAAKTFVASIRQTALGETVNTGEFLNTVDAFETFLSWLTQNGVSHDTCVICMESTGTYSEPLCYFLSSRTFSVAVEAPHKVKRAFRDTSRKTDSIDARQIAEYGDRFFDQLEFFQPHDDVVEQVRVLLSAREQFTTHMTANVNALKAIQYKPVQTALATDMYQQAIDHLKQSIKNIDEEIKRLINNHREFGPLTALLMTVPGVKLLFAANILCITDGFRRDVTPKQMASYLGICPKEYQSGTSVYRRPRSSGYGPSRLRKLLYLASMSVIVSQNNFNVYYRRKVAEGKSKKLVLNNIANKLIKIVCAVIRTKRPFISNYQSVNPRFLLAAS